MRKLLFALATLAAGCGTLPEAPPAPAPAPPVDPAPLRAAIGDDPALLDFALRVAQAESRLTQEPLTAGNRVALLVDGPAAHSAQLAAIDAAREHVHLVTYIISDDDVGQRYAQALSRKARAGVAVRLVYDSVGGLGAGPGYFAALREAGVELHEFNAVNPLEEPRLWRLNHRGHRKLLVVDGRIAFTGGINIADDYAQPSSGGRGWRDTHIRVEGPAVAAFQGAFLQTWEKARGRVAGREALLRPPARVGKDLVRLVKNEGGGERERDIYLSYLAALRESRTRAWITQAYFVPDTAFVDALKAAAQRGVDVRLLLPGTSDVGLVLHASRRYYEQLLEAGIRIHEFEDTMLHAKTAVIDGVWSTVGSSNLDYRSFLHNDEANAVILGRAFGAQMERLFLADLERARAIELETWRKRSALDKLRERFAAAIKYWL